MATLQILFKNLDIISTGLDIFQRNNSHIILDNKKELLRPKKPNYRKLLLAVPKSNIYDVFYKL